MFGSDVLDVAVGVVLLFLLVSLICTAVREGIEAILKTRAKDLEQGIREIFDDPLGTGMTKDFFFHPLIYSLFARDYKPGLIKKPKSLDVSGRFSFLDGRNLPSYIPSRNFAVALMDIIAKGPVAKTPTDTLSSTPSVISITQLRQSSILIANPKLQRAVFSAIDMAQDNLDTVQANLEAWFNTTMDRVSGWYKRRTQYILFWLGLFVALALNIDAITITERLTSDKNLRQAAVAQAEAVVSGAHANSDTSVSNAALVQLKNESFSDLNKNLKQIGFPIGWEFHNNRPYPSAQFCQQKAANRDATQNDRECNLELHDIPQLVLGWLVTALAVMLGAPFWFDVLNKFMVIRSTVKPHEKSPEESSEDR